MPSSDKIAVTVSDGGLTGTVNFIFNVAGTTNPSDQVGHISLTGTSGNDVIYNTSTGANLGGTVDTMTGGAGSDTFVFRSFSPQTQHNDVVSDFDLAQDFLNFDHTQLGISAGDVAALLQPTHALDVNGNAVITVDAHNTVTIAGVTVAQLDLHQSHIIIA